MIAVIRIRGRVGVRRDIEDTLKLLRLKRVNHCVVVPETPSYLGMIKKVKDYVAYGKINFETFLELLKWRGRLEGDKRLTEEEVKKLGFDSIEDLARKLYNGEIKFKDVPKLKPVFRLRPPKGGHKSIKEHYPRGSLGNWGEDINKLLEKMI